MFSIDKFNAMMLYTYIVCMYINRYVIYMHRCNKVLWINKILGQHFSAYHVILSLKKKENKLKNTYLPFLIL